MSKTDTPKADVQPVTWMNETAELSIHPVAEAPEAMAVIVGVVVSAGYDESGKRKAKRFKVASEGHEFVGKNVVAGINGVIKMRFGTPQHHDVAKALTDFDPNSLFPAPEPDAPKEITDWNDYENRDELASELDAANGAATAYVAGETQTRAGLVGLGRHIAKVYETFGNSSKAFNSWLAAGNADLQEALANKNSKSELVMLGNLPDDWCMNQRESLNAKGVIRLWRAELAELVNDMCAAGVGETVKKNVSAPKLDSIFVECLEEAAGLDADGNAMPDPTSLQMVARTFYNTLPEDDQLALIVKEDGVFVPATDAEGGYVYGPSVVNRAQANELLLAFLKEVEARMPANVEAAAEAEEAEKEAKATAKAVAPRTFVDLGVYEAASHLARILSAREDYEDVFGVLTGAVETADNGSWAEALSDLSGQVDEEKADAAQANEAETEGNADDDA